MNKTIWKYELSSTSPLELPIGAEILTVQPQGGGLCLWALVDPDASTEKRDIEVFGTGRTVACDMGIERHYIGTVQFGGGALVLHVFERLN